MSINQKDKGNRFEYEIAEGLSRIFGYNFKRNISGSGAYFGGGNFKRKLSGYDTGQILSNVGDIVPPTGYYIVTECKFYKSFPFHSLVQDKGVSLLFDWIEEVRSNARLFDGFEGVFFPHWIFLKVNYQGTYIFLPKSFFNFDFDCSFLLYRHVKDSVLVDSYYMLPFSYFSSLSGSMLDNIRGVITNQKYFFRDASDLKDFSG